MRVLIDECLDERIRHSFFGHDWQTVRYAKLAGLKNGQLLAAAEALGFEVLATVDQSAPYQQQAPARLTRPTAYESPHKPPRGFAATR